MPKITKRLVDLTITTDKEIIVWDDEIKGFHCKVTPKGKKVYMLYYRAKNGKQRKPSIGIHGNITCDQARQIALEWMGEIAKGNDPYAQKLEDKNNKIKAVTVKFISERYMQEHAPTKKPRSRIEDERLWKLHILPILGNYDVREVTKVEIGKLHASKIENMINANRILSLLSKAFNLAEVWGYRDEGTNPCKHIKKYPEKSRERFLKEDEIIRLFQILKEEEINAIEHISCINALRLLLLTGCRLTEILTLKWKYIDLKQHRINFPDSKTGKKSIYISDAVVEILNDIVQQENNPYVLYGKNNGEHLVNLQRAWRRIRKKADLEDVRIHDLRHSFASIGAASGLSLPIIGALLGHSQVQTTARYAHLVGDPLKEAAHVIGNKIKAIIG